MFANTTAQTSFVAREHELAQLRDRLDLALSGKGQVCFVVGEAGAGKTALISEFARRAQRSEAELLVGIGECNAQSGIGDPYLPFRELLALLTDSADADRTHPAATEENATRLSRFLRISSEALIESGPDLVGIFVPGGSLLTRLAAKLAGQSPTVARLQTLLQRKAHSGAEGEAGLRQNQIFEQYTNVIRAMSAEHPLLLILDDLQWADEASLGLLFHLARRIEGSRVLVLGAYRPDDVALGRAGQRHPLDQVLNELQRYFGELRVALGSGAEAEQLEMVNALVDAEPNLLDAEFRERLRERTQAHPLFAVELLHNLRERGDLTRNDEGMWIAGPELHWDALPARVEGVIAERIGRLEQELCETLTVASVEGEQFTAEIVARVRSADARGIVKRLSAELEKQHHLVSAQGAQRVGGKRVSPYRFRHNLFQGYLYGRLDDVERSYLHEDVGRALEELYHEQLEEVVVQLAYHFAECGDAERAVAYLLRAGERAKQQYANAEAVAHYRRGLQLLQTIQGGSGEEARNTALRLNEGLGDVLGLTAEYVAARDAYEAALSETTAEEHRTRARLHGKIASSWTAQHRMENAIPLFDAAEAELDADPTRDSAWSQDWLQLQLSRLEALYYSGSPEDMAIIAERVEPVLEDHGRPDQRASFLRSVVQSRMRTERYIFSDQSVELARLNVRQSAESGNRVALCKARFAAGFLHLWRRELDPAESELNASLALATSTGNVWDELLCRTYLTTCARFRGDPEQTRVRNAEAVEILARDPMPTYLGVAEANLAWLAWRGGDTDRVEAHGSKALQHWSQTVMAYPFHWMALWPLTVAALAGGRVEEAVAHARGMLDAKQQPLRPSLAAAIERAASCADQGDLDGARTQLAASLHEARELGYL